MSLQDKRIYHTPDHMPVMSQRELSRLTEKYLSLDTAVTKCSGPLMRWDGEHLIEFSSDIEME